MNINDLTERYLQVVSLVKVIDSDMLDSVIITLSDNSIITITVDIDTDELIANINKPMINSIKSIPILQHIKGTALIRSWIMCNHMGYQDAIQFEFFDKQNEVGYFVQLMAISSEIFVYEFN